MPQPRGVYILLIIGNTHCIAGDGVFAVNVWWDKQAAADVWRFVPGLFVGVLLFGSLSEQGLRLILGIITLLFATYMLLKPAAKKPISTRGGIASGKCLRFYQFYGTYWCAAAERLSDPAQTA